MMSIVLVLNQTMNSPWFVQTWEKISYNLHLQLITGDKHYGSPETLITDCLNTKEIRLTSDLKL